MGLKRKATMLVVVAIPTTATGAVEEAVEVAEVVDHGQARPFCTGSARLSRCIHRGRLQWR